MRLKNLDLIIAVSIASMNVVWAMLPNRTPLIGIILALPLVFFLPGYTLTEALFHKKPLEATHRLAFSIGMSLAIAILSGLILNLLPGGLQAKSWAVLLGLQIALFSLLAMILRRKASPDNLNQVRFRLRIHEGILFCLALIVVMQAIFYSTVGATQQPHPGFTQFWMLPPAQARKNCAISLGVHSFESTPVKYRIKVTVNQKEISSWSSIALSPQGEWNSLVPITPDIADKAQIVARLYRLDKPDFVYQQVDLTFLRKEYQCQGRT